ncbi:methyltransferase [Schizosaccharomyces japonicus yFS275]|uniref:Methyltransferase n=1 Tax=Schizosaccharomyces japonicus (strain yFS275 / FY16936) TaxID=402676 RepID=T0S2Z6_SCHJY|nr:methyltransferase [Schizosaccharomyces japonicus yFS275]EQC52986.1 methyltransferase [Schizosaccharomyces japonicus yFS275]
MKGKLALAGGVYLLSVYAGALGWRVWKDVSAYEQTDGHSRTQRQPSSVPIYNQCADEYKKRLRREEFWTGIRHQRRSLVRQAKGNVLEMSSGPGTNIPFYRWADIKSLTLVEPSQQMQHLAETVIRKKVPKRVPCTHYGSAQQVPEDMLYDTIIQTFGICSQQDSVTELKTCVRHLKPQGRILLLEHGRSKYGWLNRILDAYAEKHFLRWGCQWNKDIRSIVQQAGLRVESIKRTHLGTTYLLEARVTPQTSMI